MVLTAQAPPPAPTIVGLFDARKTALAKLGDRVPKSLEVSGTLKGFALNGTFHTWHDGNLDRYDEILGVREERTIRIGDREYAQNPSGDVRQLKGLLAHRQTTQDFIDSGAFLNQPQYTTLVGRTTIIGGRDTYQMRVAPPDGQPETVFLDATTSMIDRISYTDEDGATTIDYFDYRSVKGAILPFRQVESNGDHDYDVTETTMGVRVNAPIAAAVFALPKSTQIQTDRPLTVPIAERQGHYYTAVSIRGHDYEFLIDTGAQGVVVDSRVAAALLLVPNGRLEVSGATRVGGLGIAELDSIGIGAATLPVRVVSILDLRTATGGAFPIDGILGYPFFAAAEVRIDPDKMTMTIGKPGSLDVLGSKFAVDVDRQLAEINARLDGVDGRFVLDTGNGSELLIFNPFMQEHPGLIPYAGHAAVSNYGVGGSMHAIGLTIDELDMGPFRFFNRYANVMLSQSGAFADKFDAGNIGMATLRNFVTTFDLANGAMYLSRGARFDDGRYRSVIEQ
ncbi:MAG TPA: aspartyl protease family protein [Candidatus Baltobacteraceae bacterium]